MGGDVDNLALLLKSISARDRYGRDITLFGLRKALVAVLAFFPVYRTYISKESYTEKDFEYIQSAVNKAVRNNPDLLTELDFIRRFILLETADYLNEEEMEERVRFIMRFQQFTGPLMAKGFEDTMLYVFNRLLSLNEVGGDPARFGISAEEFHHFNATRCRDWPATLNTTSTHDTKRGEDVRARIIVLSELPDEWGMALKSWRKINRKKKKKILGMRVPDANDEYFLYQILLGVFPQNGMTDQPFITRISDYVIKAVREAKIHTAWLKPDTDYESSYIAFLEDILNSEKENPFLEAFLPFQKKIAYYGIFNSLSQTLLKIMSPGVPDFYQGAELWDLSLVDPDNRRPVDYEKRRWYLKEIRERESQDIPNLIDELISGKDEGMIKLFLIHKGLKTRHKWREVFQEGRYIPLVAGGTFKGHIVAFARNYGRKWVITIVPIFLTCLIKEGEAPLGRKVWNETHIILPENAPRIWTDRITGEKIKTENKCLIGDAMKSFPVSLLVGEEGDEGP
jgi:(1->4)-alpha-D-glucan 1-alpha-D-glucosylmutase